MRLYLIRHGESEANLKRLHNTPETALTETGLKQARAIAERLKEFDIDFIYSSTQKRALQTAEVVAGILKLPIETWGDITEVKTPSVNWGKPSDDSEANEIEKQIAQNYSKGNWKHSDEETFLEVKARAESVLNHLLAKHKGQKVLCVSHTSFIKMVALTAITGEYMTPDLYLKFREHAWVHNSGVTVLEYRDGRGWILATWNDTSHL
jgi:probable phosphoglycerate mutase